MEPDDVAPVAATHSVSETNRHSFCYTSEIKCCGRKRTRVHGDRAGWARVRPYHTYSRGKAFLRWRIRNTRACGFSSSGGYPEIPSGLAGPTESDTRASGQKLPSPPDVDPLHTTTTSTSLVLSGSGYPAPTPASALQPPSPPMPEKDRRFRHQTPCAPPYLPPNPGYATDGLNSRTGP